MRGQSRAGGPSGETAFDDSDVRLAVEYRLKGVTSWAAARGNNPLRYGWQPVPHAVIGGGTRMAIYLTKDGAQISYKDWGEGRLWCSATAGRSRRMLGRTRCFSWLPEDTDSSPMTGGDTADPRSLGKGTIWTPMRMISRGWSDRSTWRRGPRRALHRRWRGGTLHGAARHEAGEEGRAHRLGSPDYAADEGEPRGPSDRGVRSDSRGPSHRSIPILQGPHWSILRGQSCRGEGLTRIEGLLLAPRDDGGHKALYDCVKQFSETDFTEDLRRIDVPTFIVQGEDDLILPIANAALLQVKLVRGSRLKVAPGAPHGMCSTHKDLVNDELLAFVKE